MMRLRALLFLALILLSSMAHAGCTSPSAPAGNLRPISGIMNFCNGTNWVSTKGASLGTCTRANLIAYDTAAGTMKFCDGANWYSMKGASLGSCSGTPAGRKSYDTSLNKMKFCDGSNWYDMTAACITQGVSWSSCSGTASALAAGASSSVANTASGYTGSVTVTCNSLGTGVLAQNSASCTAITCPTQGVSWSSCSGTATGPISYGGTQTVTNTAGGYTGSVTVTCSGSGTLTQSGASCSAIPACTGYSAGGYCWHMLTGLNQSCNTVCASYGGTTDGTINYTGSGGTNANCTAVMNHFYSGAVTDNSTPASVGCVHVPTTSINLRVIGQPTTQDAVYAGQRLCSCVE